MKQILLMSLVATSTVSMLGGTPQNQLNPAAGVNKVKFETLERHTPESSVKKIASGISLTTERGVKKLNAPAIASGSKVAPKYKKSAKYAAPDGFALYEDFEEWDGVSFEWIPEGWTVEMNGKVERDESWIPAASSYFMATTDGNYFYGINYGSDDQDEWLISPSVEIKDGYELSFISYIDPTFIFSLDNVDWSTYEFIGEPEVAATLQIWVKPEDADWVMIHDFVDDYTGMSLMDLMYAATYSFDPHSFSLSQFAGENVNIAFRYVGYDGNTMGVDAIGVGYASLDDISYLSPFSSLYWGFDRSWEMTSMSVGIAQYPVFDPITWINYSYADNATYTWTYCDPVTSEFVTSDDQDELSVTYIPDYSSDFTKRNNLFYPPILTASAPNSAPGSYTAPYTYFQAGGKFEYVFSSGEKIEGGLLPFNFNDLGLKVVMYDDPTIGDPAIPLFGYNVNTDQYWINYSLNGEEKNESDFNKLIGVANLIIPTEAPLVVNGVTMNAYGKVADDAEFTATIWALDEDMHSDINTFTKLAESTISGADILRQSLTQSGYLCLPFDFDAPVVLKSSDQHPAFFVEVSGFNSEKVEYFAPLQSGKDDVVCHGYIHSYIDLSSHGVRDGAYHSFKTMQYKDGNDYVDPVGSFAIGLNAEYPWLTTDCEGIVLGSEPVEISLGSYYDGSQLTVDAPAGVDASVSGRYDECILTAQHNADSVVVDGVITVKGPGVEVSIPVSEATVGVEAVIASDAKVVEMYDLNGRVVNPSTASAGVYVAKLSNGIVRKLIVK